MIEDADPALTPAERELRSVLYLAFEVSGYDKAIQLMGKFPESMAWGDRIYNLMRASFLQGGLCVAATYLDEEETD